MEKTFGYQRQEIVHKKPSIEGVLERWPTFGQALHQLLEVIRSKGGVTVDITIRRECILKSLMIYLGEPVQHLIKEYQDFVRLWWDSLGGPVEEHFGHFKVKCINLVHFESKINRLDLQKNFVLFYDRRSLLWFQSLQAMQSAAEAGQRIGGGRD
ncbi:hypothetical protein N1851_002911 [Merluccius polli]|uniref:Uncharacterized protein n=1 Tax=Merluccius polli TaxID=89951 RepID=A0AA47N993_MERPO|nr:hypothetical protein N1851_002911 [Merluccius polli]